MYQIFFLGSRQNLPPKNQKKMFIDPPNETWGAGVETQENKKIVVPLSKKDKTKKSNESWT